MQNKINAKEQVIKLYKDNEGNINKIIKDSDGRLKKYCVDGEEITMETEEGILKHYPFSLVNTIFKA